MEDLLMPFCIAAFIAIIATPIVKKLAWQKGIIDIPKDNRRVHKEPMPLMGGLAIYLAIIITSIIFLPLNRSLIAIILGGTLILISGVIDDAKALSPKLKLIFQLAAGMVLIMGDVKIDFITNPFSNKALLLNLRWLSIPLTLIWVMGITNTLNLIDGLDGLAVGIAMISSISLMLVAYRLGYDNTVILASIVAGSCLGFLPYNFRPARIFMGDTGALFLGFILSAISIEGVMKSVATISIVVPIFILGLPIFDTILAILRRLSNGKSIAVGDKDHIHHRLVKSGLSQRDTVLVLYSISIIIGIFSVLIANANNNRAVIISMILFAIGIMLAIKSKLFNNN